MVGRNLQSVMKHDVIRYMFGDDEAFYMVFGEWA